MAVSVLGLDIGGANLKAAHSTGIARLEPFELWKNPAHLPIALEQLLQGWPRYDYLAVTMTGELCDCFETRQTGVEAILDAADSIAREIPLLVWQIDGRFVSSVAARQAPLQTAAANWLALATFAGRFATDPAALLIDIGSTTTDIVPLLEGKPVPRGRNDYDRLREHELVYTGVRRTPVCALLAEEVAAELFATTLDAYLTLGNIPEQETDRASADSRPATKEAAHSRLAHMLCLDAQTCPKTRTFELAKEVRSRQIQLIRNALNRVASALVARPSTAIVSGSGEFLADAVLDQEPRVAMQRLSLSEILGPDVSHAACAYAVARLAMEHIDAGE
jgi:probable H4MPT-linked C1 transfer pathway protein